MKKSKIIRKGCRVKISELSSPYYGLIGKISYVNSLYSIFNVRFEDRGGFYVFHPDEVDVITNSP